MNILLLVPPTESTKNVVRDVIYGCWCKGKRIGGATVPPLILLSVATVLKNDRNNIRLLDAIAENKSLNYIKEIIPHYDVLILLTSTMTFREDVWLISKLKKENKNLISIIFGSHPTFMPKYCLKEKAVDIIVRNEAEFIIRDVIRKLRSKKSWKNVKGVGYRKGNRIIVNKNYPFIKDLDKLPIYDRSLLPKKEYYNPVIKKYPYTTTETSRGCPGRCSFCTVPAMYGNVLRSWSAEKVIKEIELLTNLGYKEIYYRDETFSAFPKRNKKICEHIIKNKINVSWVCNVRAGSVTKDMLRLMKKAGCHLIKIGVESGVQEILNKSKKGITIKKIKDLFKWSREFKIDTHAHLMFGMPGETKETIKRTIKFIKKIEPTTIDVGICTPYPGSELFSYVIKNHPKVKDGSYIDLKKLHTSGLFNEYYTNLKREELEKSIGEVYRGFYLRPKYILKRLLEIRNPAGIKNLIKAGINTTLFSIKGGD